VLGVPRAPQTEDSPGLPTRVAGTILNLVPLTVTLTSLAKFLPTGLTQTFPLMVPLVTETDLAE